MSASGLLPSTTERLMNPSPNRTTRVPSSRRPGPQGHLKHLFPTRKAGGRIHAPHESSHYYKKCTSPRCDQDHFNRIIPYLRPKITNLQQNQVTGRDIRSKTPDITLCYQKSFKPVVMQPSPRPNLNPVPSQTLPNSTPAAPRAPPRTPQGPWSQGPKATEVKLSEMGAVRVMFEISLMGYFGRHLRNSGKREKHVYVGFSRIKGPCRFKSF